MSGVSFDWFSWLEELGLRYFLMTLLIKNGGYAFSIRFDLIFSMSLWKKNFKRPIYQTFN